MTVRRSDALRTAVELPPGAEHGTLSSYTHHGCRCDPCSIRWSQYEKHRDWLARQGRSLRVDSRGFRRRVQSLMWMGWPQVVIGERLGVLLGMSRPMRQQEVSAKVNRHATISRRLHDAMAQVYDELSGSFYDGPTAARTRSIARRNGWVSPWAWDDIDSDERPQGARAS